MSRRPLPPSSAMTRSWQVYPHNTDRWLVPWRAALDAVALALADMAPGHGLWGWAELRVFREGVAQIELTVWRLADLEGQIERPQRYAAAFQLEHCTPISVYRSVQASLKAVPS